MSIKFNPIYDKIPRGASVEGEEVKFSLRLSHAVPYDEIKFVIIDDKTNKTIQIPMIKTDECESYSNFEVSHIFEKGIYWYHFEIIKAEKITYIVQNDVFDGVESNKLTTSFAQIVTKKMKITKNHNLIYHVFVDRFCKVGSALLRDGFTERKDWGGEIQKHTKNPIKINQEVFGGNLKGVIKKLDYIQSLGVDLIYLSPIFTANSYHKYDTANYKEIDPMFGDKKIFLQLIKEAKKRGMGVVLDGVFNHTGSDSIYFNKNKRYDEVGAYNSKDSKYFDWYNFTCWPEKYDSWWGINTLPAVKENNEDFANFITGKNGVIEKWMKCGVDGFRLDVVDELSNNLLTKISSKIKSFGNDKLVLGEVWEDASIKQAYGQRRSYFVDRQIDSVMNYPLKNGILAYISTGNEKELVKRFYMLLDHYPANAQHNLMNIIGTHDSNRVASVIDGLTDNEERKFALLKIATTLQYGFIGSPAIFYGDERGVRGGEAPLCRVCFPWEKVDTKEEKWYKLLGKIRKSPILKNGELNLLFADNGVVVFERIFKKNKIVFAVNMSGDDFTLDLKQGRDLINNKSVQYTYVVKNDDVAIIKLSGDKQ